MDTIAIREKLMRTEDNFDAIVDFANAITLSIAPEISRSDDSLGSSLHRLATEIRQHAEAIARVQDEIVKSISGAVGADHGAPAPATPAPDETVAAARAALPEAAFGMAVFESLDMAKAYIGALNIMSLDPDLDGNFSKPLWRLVCDVSDLLDDIKEEADKVWLLGRQAVGGLPPLPDDGNGEVEPAVGDA